MTFVALDVETANPDLASICQIGVAVFEDGRISETWHTYVNPEDYFDEGNTAVHGIREDHTRDAPTLPQVYDRLRGLLSDRVVAHHTAFNKAALAKAAQKYRLSDAGSVWLDTARVARRAWPAFAARGYGLASVAQALGISFKHHAAPEDARATGEILLRAVSETGLTASAWLKRVEQPIDPSVNTCRSRDGNPDGVLAGEVLVFTGALSMARREAADLAAEAGCDVAASVTKHTTLLVVGDQDVRRLLGHEKSSKHRKAEELILKGQAIRILGETDFLQLIRSASRSADAVGSRPLGAAGGL